MDYKQSTEAAWRMLARDGSETSVEVGGWINHNLMVPATSVCSEVVLVEWDGTYEDKEKSAHKRVKRGRSSLFDSMRFGGFLQRKDARVVDALNELLAVCEK